ncbi:hypothetical protein Tco_0331086, partial [Tanacetum coccineum]
IARIVKALVLVFLSRVSHPQLHFGNPETDIQEKEQKESQKQANPSTEWKGQSQKSSQVKKIQLEGLKLPKPQDVLQKRKTRVKIAKKGQFYSVKVQQSPSLSPTSPQPSVRHPPQPITTNFTTLYAKTHVAEEAVIMPHDSPLLRVHYNLTVNFIAPEEDYTAEPDISTANVPVTTVGAEVSTANPEVKTAAESLVYIREVQGKKKKANDSQISWEGSYHFHAKEWDNTSSNLKLMKEGGTSSKKQKIGEGSEPAEESKDELSQEQLKTANDHSSLKKGDNVVAYKLITQIIGLGKFYTVRLKEKYWKIIRVGNHTEVYQIFEDMLKNFDRDDLVKLWSLVHERFNSTEPTEDKERELWVELKRLFEPDDDDTLWKL